MCLKKLFGKEEKQEEDVEEVEVERRSVDELMETMDGLSAQLRLVLKDVEDKDAEIVRLEGELQAQYEATCEAKDQIVDLLNQIAALERRLDEIENIARGSYKGILHNCVISISYVKKQAYKNNFKKGEIK